MKIPDVELLKLKDPGLMEFMDFTQIILNDGRYEMRVISSIPDWTANEGEFLCYAAGNVRRLYSYINGQWIYSEFNSATSTIFLSKIYDTDADTKVDCEESSDEDIIRFDAGGTEVMSIDSNEVAIASGLQLTLDSLGGDSYIKYNAGTDYVELWADGTKRIEY